MKITLAGSSEKIAELISKFFNKLGHEVQFIVQNPSKPGELSYDQVEKEGLPPCDAIINLPQKMILRHPLGSNSFEKEFFETRINPTHRLKEVISKSAHPPKAWISFSSVGIYPKEKAMFHKETTEAGSDPTAELIKQWESAALLPDTIPTRHVVLRLGLVISKFTGVLPHITPFFKMGLGSVLGEGGEAFPWIYMKDLYWLLDYTVKSESMQGVYNTVAPQLINSRDFSTALSRVMKKPVWFKFPKNFYIKRLGDAAEIVFSRSIVFPSRLLKSGFEFRYPAIYPALIDCLSHGSLF